MYDYLKYKTIDDINSMLPINGRTKLFTDVCGKYIPERDKTKYGDMLAITIADFTENYLYIGVYPD